MESKTIQDYLNRIEILRSKMIIAGMTLGLDHPRVLQYSRDIDESHNRLMKMATNNAEPPLAYTVTTRSLLKEDFDDYNYRVCSTTN